MSTLFKITISFTPNEKDLVLGLLYEYGVTALIEEDARVVLYSEDKVYCDDLSSFIQTAPLPSEPSSMVDIDVEEVTDKSWETYWKQHWHGTQVTKRLFVGPPWSDSSSGNGRPCL